MARHENDPTIVGDLRTKSTVAARWPDGAVREVAWFTGPNVDGPWKRIRGVSTAELKLLEEFAGAHLMAETTASDGNVRRSDPVRIAHQDGNADTDWLHEAGFGISHHLLADWVDRVATTADQRWQHGEDWDAFLSTFDVDAYLEQVRSTGARFVLLTLGQNSGYLLGRNRAFESIAGLTPGQRTPSRRDLVREIAEGLDALGVRTMLYLPANPPEHAHRDAGDFAITDAFGGFRQNGFVPTQESIRLWQQVIREFSETYGELVSGWWFDGVFPAMAPSYDDMGSPQNWSTLTAAAKAGNLRRIVAYNIGIEGTAGGNPWVDYEAGETNELNDPPHSRWADEATGVQWFALTYLGAEVPDFYGWGNAGTSKPTADLARWVTEVVDHGGAVCLDTRVDRFGRIDPEQLAQLIAVREALGR